jgi:hypothetical protein
MGNLVLICKALWTLFRRSFNAYAIVRNYLRWGCHTDMHKTILVMHATHGVQSELGETYNANACL